MTQAGIAWPALDELDLLACPSCRTLLAAAQCPACGSQYPLVADVPCLFPAAADRLAQWRNRWLAELARLNNEQTRLEPALAAAAGLTRQRLKRRLHGLRGQTQALQTVLAPLLQEAAGRPANATALAFDADSGWYRYDANPFRDWCWGEAENAAALSQILLALGDRPQHILQLGSGAGRLAYDLHRSLEPRVTLAVEHNPLLALLGARLAAGATQKLWEFPLSPNQVEDNVVQQTLQRPTHHAPLAPGLTTLLADVLTLPLSTGRFDLVVTSWFSDICPAPADWLSTTIAALLKPGGLWINHGSAAFDPTATSNCGSLAEFMTTVGRQGFTVHYEAEAELPYLQSPHSRQKRIERVGTQAFQKPSEAPTPDQLPPWETQRPNWAEDATVPIALSRAVTDQREASALRAFILSLVDGQRSRRDIAGQLAARGILSQVDAEAALTEMLLNIQR